MSQPASLGFHPADERRHAPGAAHGVEVWTLDFVQADASVAGSIWLVLGGDPPVAAFHASIVRPGEQLVTLSEIAAAVPAAPSLELRASGLWAEVGVQTPWEHVTVDIEAFAVGLDDPDEVFGRAYGDRVALGSELEWETAGDIRAHADLAATGYSLPCGVHGELLLGDAAIEIDGWGWRSHHWGEYSPREGWTVRGRADDDSWLFEAGAEGVAVDAVGRSPIATLIAGAEHAVEQRFVQAGAGGRAWARRFERR